MANKSLIGLVVGVIGCILAFVMLILSCVFDNVWWPMLMLIPLVILPFPLLALYNADLEDPGFGNVDGIAYIHWPSFGIFFAGAVAACPIALPSVMGHLLITTVKSTLLAVFSMVVLYISVALLVMKDSLNWSSSSTSNSKLNF